MAYILSGFTDEFDPKFSKQIEGAIKLGLSHIELRFVDGVNVSAMSDAQLDYVKDLLDKNSIKVSAIGSPIGKIALSDDFEKHFELAERVFKIANRLDCKNIRVFSFYLDGRDRKECFNEVVEKLNRLLVLADAYGVVLCLENEAALYGESPEQIYEICSYFDGKIRTVMDMGNYVLGGYQPYPLAYEMLKGYVEYFHVKDAYKTGEIVPCGEGDACIEQILCAYKKDYPNKETFVSSEPHLTDFVGLSNLANHQLKKKVTFESEAQAFTYAFNALEQIIKNF